MLPDDGSSAAYDSSPRRQPVRSWSPSAPSDQSGQPVLTSINLESMDSRQRKRNSLNRSIQTSLTLSSFDRCCRRSVSASPFFCIFGCILCLWVILQLVLFRFAIGIDSAVDTLKSVSHLRRRFNETSQFGRFSSTSIPRMSIDQIPIQKEKRRSIIQPLLLTNHSIRKFITEVIR